MRNLRKILIPSLLAIPGLAFAQLSNIHQLIFSVGEIVDSLIVIVAGIAVLVFFWGLVKFILSAGSEIDKQKGKDLMIWGIIALFVMVSIWGLINFIAAQLAIDNAPGQNAPNIRGLVPNR